MGEGAKIAPKQPDDGPLAASAEILDLTELLVASDALCRNVINSSCFSESPMLCTAVETRHSDRRLYSLGGKKDS